MKELPHWAIKAAVLYGYALPKSRMRRLCEWVAGRFPRRVIMDREGGTPYLSRFYIFGGPCSLEDDVDEYGQMKKVAAWKSLPVNLYLHCFHRSDDDRATHSNPWRWAVSLILVGGYREERRVGTSPNYRVESRVVRPGSLNVIRADDFHRVDLLEKDCWSLFLAGPKAKTWYFWDRDTGETLHWRAFIAKKRGQPIEEIA